MDLHAALTTLADYLDLDAAELIAYAEADPFTGWDDGKGTAELWVLGVQKLQPGGVMISHDSEHPTAGPDVRAGVALAGVTGTISLLIEPADCGLLVYRKPGQWIDPELPLTKEELKGVIKGDALEVKADGEAKLNRRRAPDKVTRTPAKKTAAKK